MNYIEIFRQSVLLNRGKTALVDRDGTRPMTYGELDALSDHVAGKLHALGCKRGDFILVRMDRRSEYVAAYLGILKAGCAVVPTVEEYPEERVSFIRENCGSKLTVTEEFFDGIETFAPFSDLAGDREPALLAYTSGSTGTPKGILLSVGDICRSALRHRNIYEGVEPLVMAGTALFSFLVHVFEYLTVFSMGGTTYIVSERVRKSIDEIADFYKFRGITVCWMAPQFLRVFLKAKEGPFAIQRIITGSERVSEVYSDKISILNLYGSSEVAAIVSRYDIPAATPNTPIGKALPGTELLICDEENHPVPDGTEGEICVLMELDTVYFKDPEKTARCMIPMPDGRTLFRSGDLGYIREDGNAIYVNRKDWMVKVNGQRVETGEIEGLLLTMDEVASAAVKAFADSDGQNYLVAYYTLRADLSSDAIRERLESKVASYMIPRFLVRMDELPKNVNGKVNKNALLPPDTERYKASYAAPESETEKALCGGFEQVLHCGRVGRDDNFFALGGDSIKVLKLLDAVGLPGLTPADVLQGKTPRGIASLCGGRTENEITHSDELLQYYPMTDSQKGVYLECMEDPDSLMYNIPMLCRLPAGTDRAAFLRAVGEVLALHPALQVTTCSPAGVPSMKYGKTVLSIEEKTVSDVEAEKRSFVRPFDLEKGPLCRFELWHAPEGDFFALDVHHLVFDGTSAEVFLHQIADAYDGKELFSESLSLFDLSFAEQKQRESAAYAQAREHFAKTLGGIEWDSKPVPDRYADRPARKAGCVRLSSEGFFDASDVQTFIRTHGLTESSLFTGAFAYALAKFCGTGEAHFCTVNNGRHDPRLERAVGMFVRTLPLCFAIDEAKEIPAFLSDVQDGFFAAMKHDLVPFGELASEYGVNTDVVFVYQSELLSGCKLKNGFLEAEMLETGDAQSELDVMLLKTARGYEILSHYRTASYTEELISSFARLLFTVISEFLRRGTLAEVSLTDGAVLSALEKVNATEREYDRSQTVVSLFRKRAKQNPDDVCLVYLDKQFTYREVDELTDRIASFLSEKGIGRETVTGVLIPRSEWMLLCSLGVLKAGGGYMPLDPSYPPERLNLMMRDSAAKLLLTTPELNEIITDEFKGERIMTDDLLRLPACERALPEAAPGDLFVLLYTSGSTGTPKGVMFEHSNMLCTAEWVKRYFEMDETSAVAAYASYGFDAHSFEIYPAIISGARLHIIPEEMRLDFPVLKDYFNENGITHTVMTTQIGRQFAGLGGLKTLRHLSVAGEKLTPLDPPADIRFYNLYGPTEGSVVTSAYRMESRCTDVPIGTAVDNLKTFVVDKNGKLLPFGAVGELWIAGPHVTRGYLNRPEKTAEAYGENPFCKAPGYDRVYRTGDIVRLLSDGNLQFVGRRDAQVKIRGFRIELTEVEEVIRRFDGIRDATVAAFDLASGGKALAAYVVSDADVDKKALGDFIRAEKPPYMVPSVVMRLEKIPLNQNGKVNRKALPVPEKKTADTTPPETETQKRVYAAVAEVVGQDAFGIDTDLGEAGLTSIGSVRLTVVLGEAFSAVVKIKDLKEQNTVRKLSAFLETASSVEQAEKRADYPLTQTQSGILVECLSAPGTTKYNIPVLLKLGDEVELPKLEKALRIAIDAHPFVKTRLFAAEDGSVRASRRDEDDPIVSRIDAPLPDENDLIRPFELMGGPLYRAEIYHTVAGNYLLLDFHHIVSDGTSEQILLTDITKAYDGKPVAKETYTGFENALDEEQSRSGETYENAKKFYETLCSGHEGSILPQKAPEQTEHGSAHIRLRGKADVPAIMAFCDRHGVTPSAFFNTVFGVVLSRFAYKDEAVFTTVYNGRNDSRLASTVSMLVKTLPVLFGTDGETKITDLIPAVQEQLMNSMANDVYSFAEIASAYGIRSDVIFVYQGESMDLDAICGESATMIPLDSDAAKAPLSLNVYLKNGALLLDAEYDKAVFCAPFAESVLHAFDRASSEFLRADRLKDLSLTTDEGEATYALLNGGSVACEQIPAHRLFEREAAAHPDRPAAYANGETLTYGELNALANRLSHALSARCKQRNAIVGMLLDRGNEVFVAELGIQKAGFAFLPMLPSYPDDRIDYSLTNAESPLVVTTGEIRDSRPELFAEGKPYTALTVEELLACTDESDPAPEILPGDLAYCIYTSGSTGTPKGVMIRHENLTHFVFATRQNLRYLRDDTLTGSALCMSSVSFDMSIYEILPPLCFGKTLCMATDKEIHDPLAFTNLILEQNVQMVCCTPSFLTNMVGIPEFLPALTGLKTLTVGAEAFPAPLYDVLKLQSPDLQLINGYGPTETTICCSMKELRSGTGVTIGRPTGNTKLYVIDRYGHVNPPYAAGELIICGESVGSGYVRLPEKNASSFFALRGLSAYHSGDLVRLTGEGEIEFGGRLDNQVKIRGFRVELDEIENVMRTYPGVAQSKVVVRGEGSEAYLAGFFTADTPIDLSLLTDHLKAKLTYYMVPAVLMQLEAMPLTANGKIDKAKLPEVQKTARKSGRRSAKKSLEERLCEMFRDVLSLEDCYADDNFFELGGTSLSASKVTMKLMSEGIKVEYGDIFDHPTPEELSAFIESRGKEPVSEQPKPAETVGETYEALSRNTAAYAKEVVREPLGNVLLTGSTGFLGIHVLKELLELHEGHIYCLARKGTSDDADTRLKTMMAYYFDDPHTKIIEREVTVVDADITDDSLGETLKDIPFDTVINCAACVKHFASDDILERINVHGVENLIRVCVERDARLVQISTVSVPGIHTDETYARGVKMHENELFVVNSLDSKYITSKYKAEKKILQAIREEHLRAKIIRVGNLMGRHSDGEFQVNFNTNMFLSGIRGFATLGMYPVSHMTDPMRFSPVDRTARAIVLLSGTNDCFTAFHADNRYGFDEMKVIDACNRNGVRIDPKEDAEYYEIYNRMLGNSRLNSRLNGLAAYDRPDLHAVETDNLFTTNILYRLGFSWPLMEDSYLDKVIRTLVELDYFDMSPADWENMDTEE